MIDFMYFSERVQDSCTLNLWNILFLNTQNKYFESVTRYITLSSSTEIIFTEKKQRVISALPFKEIIYSVPFLTALLNNHILELQ